MKTSLRSIVALILSILLPLQMSADSSSSSSSSSARCSSSTDATIIYVNADATGANDGSSWENAFTTLQPALDVAASIAGPKQIWVANGTYYPTRVDPFAPRSIRPTFLIPDLTEIIGGFKGDEECVNQRHLTQPSKTIFSGLSIPQANHVVTLDKVSVIIDGVTIRDGVASMGGGNADRENGGGIFIWSGNTILNNVSLIDNNAVSSANAGGTGLGGGLYASRLLATDPAPVILLKNMLVDFNLANRLGGGMFFAVATVDMFDSIVSNNRAFRPFANTFSQGGGFQISEGSANVTNCVFENNRSENNSVSGSGLGGAIYAFDTNGTVVTIKCSKFLNNFAGNQGGALYNNTGVKMYVFDSLLDGNIAPGATFGPDGGGAARTFGLDFVMINCTLSNNRSSQGGALRLGGISTLKNCKLFNNSSSINDGAITVFAPVVIDNCVIENNTAINLGGGIGVIDGNSLLLLDSQVRNNTAPSGGGIFNNGIITVERSTISYNRAFFVNGVFNAGNGGGIYIHQVSPGNGAVSILNSKIENNVAEVHGGGVYIDNNGIFKAQNSLFSQNSAANNGGAFYGTSLSFITSRNTFNRNTAENGGAIFYTNVLTTPFNVSITENNFYKNTGSVSGGAIAVVDAPTSDVDIIDNIFRKNVSPQGEALSIVNSSADVVGNSFEECEEDCCVFFSNSSINDKTDPAEIDTYLRFLNCCDSCGSSN